MSDRRLISHHIDVFDDGYSDIDVPLAEAITLLQDALAEVPEECRADATLCLWTDSEEGVVYTCVRWDTPETDEELSERIAKDAATKISLARHDEQREREQLAMLKAKYEP